jgi:DNA recombination protein RmuC
MEILYLLIGFVVGGIIVYLIVNGKVKNVDSQLMLSHQQLEQEQKSRQSVQSQLDSMNDYNKELNAQITQIKVELGRANAQLDAEREQNSKEMQMRREQFEQQLKTVQEQFSNLATKVLNQTSDQLKSTNTENFENLTKPLKQNIEQLHQAIQTTNSETAKSTASLSQQLKEMSEQTHKIDATATRLTNVIRGGNKAQGNWGERLLTDILDAQGFSCGTDYDVQYTITDDKGNVITNDESGKRMIPDVVLHYPNNEDVVIDSKMSIDAYYQYVNTEDETLKKKFADDMVKSIRTQMTGLAKKDYSQYIKKPRRAIDFVIMFVPNEGALQLALAREPKLWGEAFDKQVFITSQQNLMAILKMIQIAWRQYAQTENQKRVFDMAEEMLKRVGEFIKRFDKVGKDLDVLRNDYQNAHDKAYTGRQSIVQKANELKELGVKESANQPIPPIEPDLLNEE